MARLVVTRVLLSLGLMLVSSSNLVHADLIPPGNKGVSHKLVIVDSPLLASNRIIAMPTRGFGGHEEVRAGKPFHFSSKYGTRLYVVPDDYEPPAKLRSGDPLPFPHGEIPVTSTTYVPLISSVDSLRSTCKVTEIGEDSITIELIDHIKLDSRGRPVTLLSSALPMLAISMVGCVCCGFVWRWTRRSKKPAAV